ncbi:MAG TPA: DUF6677 family protein [Candidatus Acidoferrales bacterium]
MAEPSVKRRGKARTEAPENLTLAFFALVAGWLVPGLGHVLVRRWVRALVFFTSVAVMALGGMAMKGQIFPPSFHDIFDLGGFLADLGTGMFYLGAGFLGYGAGDISRATGDYGTRFIAGAGLLNLLCVLDAFDIARKRKA